MVRFAPIMNSIERQEIKVPATLSSQCSLYPSFFISLLFPFQVAFFILFFRITSAKSTHAFINENSCSTCIHRRTTVKEGHTIHETHRCCLSPRIENRNFSLCNDSDPCIYQRDWRYTFQMVLVHKRRLSKFYLRSSF